MRLTARPPVTLAATIATALVVLLGAQPAWAHARLLSTSPADGASVTTPVSAVTLTFNEPVKQQFTTIVVTGSDSINHAQGAPRSVDASLTQPVGALPAGQVRVAWRTVSSDGHPVEGQFTFTNAAAAGDTGPSTAGPAVASAPSPAPAAPPTAGHDGSWTGWVVAGGVVVLVAIGAGWWWRRRTARA